MEHQSSLPRGQEPFTRLNPAPDNSSLCHLSYLLKIFFKSPFHVSLGLPSNLFPQVSSPKIIIIVYICSAYVIYALNYEMKEETRREKRRRVVLKWQTRMKCRKSFVLSQELGAGGLSIGVHLRKRSRIILTPVLG